jgi:hypothetical protein
MFMPGATPQWKKVKVGMTRAEVRELIGRSDQLPGRSALRSGPNWTEGYYIEGDQFLRIHYKNGVATRLQVTGNP